MTSPVTSPTVACSMADAGLSATKKPTCRPQALTTDMLNASASSSPTAALKDLRCPIKAIPPEIRNRIYELVLFDGDRMTAVELLEAKPPTKDLLLVCRQFHDEAKSMHQAACREYWSSTKFDITLPIVPAYEVKDKLRQYDLRPSDVRQHEILTKIRAVPEQTLSYIKSLEIRGQQVHFHRNRGIWFQPVDHSEALVKESEEMKESLEAQGGRIEIPRGLFGTMILTFPVATDGSPIHEKAMRLLEGTPLTQSELEGVVCMVDKLDFGRSY